MQAEIIELLEKVGAPLGRAQIAEKLKERPEKITNHLTRLVKSEQVLCLEIDKDQALEHFNSKRRMRLYYVEVLPTKRKKKQE